MLAVAITTEPDLLRVSLQILQWLGIPSLAGFLALYVGWLSFPPELFIEAVVDKSKKFSSESRIRIKNNGKLPARGIAADLSRFSAKMGGLGFKDCGFIGGPPLASKLSSGEAAEISVSPGISLGGGVAISECSYSLTLRYYTKLFWFKKQFYKTWKIELRVFQDGFAWHVQNA